ncbi:MAG: hypothetical protein WCQ50_04315 [Spirochaetota bacterium]
MRAFRLSVPANLLLVGEYAVTEEGGLGIALAAQPRVCITVSPASSLQIEGLMGTLNYTWDLASRKEPPSLAAACLAVCQAAGLGSAPGASNYSAAGASNYSAAGASNYSATGASLWPFAPARIVVDSSAFFSADGSKRGLGSSAATAVALVAALLALGGLEDEDLRRASYPLALAAHRSFQGGRGSGYDVAASCFGGLGLFTGGATPSWEALVGGAPGRRLSPAALPSLALFRGPKAVSSPESVGLYQAWRLAHPGAFRDFLAASQAGVLTLADTDNPAKALEALKQAARRGLELGAAIGVPADFGAEGSYEGPRDGGGPASSQLVIKALGAGNELGLKASLEARAWLEPLILEPEGLRWD